MTSPSPSYGATITQIASGNSSWSWWDRWSTDDVESRVGLS